MKHYGQVKGRSYPADQPTPNIRKTEKCARCGFDRPLKDFKTYRRPDGSYYRIKVCAECHEKSLGQ